MTTPSPFAKSIAVIIGIDRYAVGIPQLRSAVNDARRLSTILGGEHGYSVIALLDADASQERITHLLTSELPAIVGPDDRVLFYFAGHGVARDGDEGPTGYLLPADAKRGDESTYLDMPRVHAALLALTCRHMLVVLDSCFSGAFRWSGTRAVVEKKGVVHKEKFDRFVKDPAWQVITSAAQDQKALDQLSSGVLGTRDGEGAHSPFALALFDAIAGEGDVIPRGTGDGLVTATELFLYLQETLQSAVLVAGKEQTPGLWPLKKHDKGEYLFFVPGRALNLPPAPPLTFDNNPWRGLASYDAADAALYFGRDAEIDALCTRIDAAALTVVLGASGTGKSSLVKAGAIPKLLALGHQAMAVIRPGSSPLEAMAQALTASGQPPVDATSHAIVARVKALLDAQPGRRLLLVIDQFEELITLTRRSEDREQTLSLLASLLTDHPDALRIVLTIRTDFEPNFDRSAFGDRWLAGRFVVPPMSRDDLRAVIEKPAETRVLYFEPSALVETLLDEVVATPGALPLLSFALSEMYRSYVTRRSADRAITRADYDAIGGVVGALRSRAEAEYAACDASHRATMRRVMLRLVSIDGGTMARRRVTDAELAYDSEAERTRAEVVVRQLTGARLLVQGKEPDGEAFVEPSHDALVRGWGRLLQWVREENEARYPLAQQQRLARAAQEWDRADAGERSGLLWSDASRSAQLAPLVRSRAAWLNRREMAFATRSIRGRRLALGTAIAAGLTIVAAATVAVVGARRASLRAEQVRIGAVIRTATTMVQEDPLVASLLLGGIDSAQVRTADEATRMAMLGAALELRAGPHVVATFDADRDVSDADVSADGSQIVTAAADSIVRVWRSDGRQAPVLLRGATSEILTVRLSPAGDRVAAGLDDGTILVWNTDGSGTVRTIIRDAVPVFRLEFSRDGHRMLVARAEGPAQIWSTDGTGPPVTIGRPGSTVVQAIWGEGDTRIVAVLDDGTAELWSSGEGTTLRRATPLRTIPRVAGSAFTVGAVSPDGHRVALGATAPRGGGFISVVTLGAAAQATVTLPYPRVGIVDVKWSPDGRRLVSTADDSLVTFWDATRGVRLSSQSVAESMQSADFSPDGTWVVLTSPNVFQPLVVEPGNASAPITLSGQNTALVRSVFLPDSRHVLTASQDGSVRVWALPPPVFYRNPATRDDEPPEWNNVGAVAFSPDGKHSAIATTGGTVALYTLDESAPPVVLDSLMSGLRAIAFSADGNQLLGLAVDGMRRAWRVRTATRVVDLPANGPILTAAEFSADARHILTMNELREVHVWDAWSPAAPWRLRAGRDESAACQALSADSTVANRCSALADDGALAAAVVRGDTVRVFRVGAATPSRVIVTPRQSPTALQFTRDGARLAVGYRNGSTRIFTVAATDTGQLFGGHQKPVTQIGFAAADRRMLTVSRSDNTIRIRTLPTGTTANALRIRGQSLEDARFTADGRRLLTLGYGELDARLWNADGSGNPIPLPGNRAVVSAAYPSPDGRWVMTGTMAQTAQLYPIDVEYALRPLRGLRLCLSVAERMRYLSEREPDAAARHAACHRARATALPAPPR